MSSQVVNNAASGLLVAAEIISEHVRRACSVYCLESRMRNEALRRKRDGVGKTGHHGDRGKEDLTTADLLM